MSNKRNYVFGIYFVSILSLLILRICSSLDFFSLLSSNEQDIFFTLISQVLCLGVIPTILYFVFRKKYIEQPNFLKDFSYKHIKGSQIWIVLIVAILMLIVNTLFAMINVLVLSALGYSYSVSPGTNYYSVGILFLNIFLVGVCPATFEEFANRGLLKQAFDGNAKAYILMSGLMFALMHQNAAQVIYTFFGGVVMAYTVYYTGSIFAGMIIHFCINTYNVLTSYGAQNGGFLGKLANIKSLFLNVNNPFMIILGFVICIIALILLVFLLKLLKQKSDRKNENQFYEIVWDDRISEYVKVHKKKVVTPAMAKVFIAATIFIGIGANLFTYIWGVMR